MFNQRVIIVLVKWEARRRGLGGQNPPFVLVSGGLNYDEHLDFIKHVYFTKEKGNVFIEYDF